METLTILANLEALRSSYGEVRVLRDLMISFIERYLTDEERAFWHARTQPDLQPAYPAPSATLIRAQVAQPLAAPPVQQFQRQPPAPGLAPSAGVTIRPGPTPVPPQMPGQMPGQVVGQSLPGSPALGGSAQYDQQGGLMSGVLQAGGATVSVRPPPGYGMMQHTALPVAQEVSPVAAASNAIAEVPAALVGKEIAELVEMAKARGVTDAEKMGQGDLLQMLASAEKHDIARAAAAGEFDGEKAVVVTEKEEPKG